MTNFFSPWAWCKYKTFKIDLTCNNGTFSPWFFIMAEGVIKISIWGYKIEKKVNLLEWDYCILSIDVHTTYIWNNMWPKCWSDCDFVGSWLNNFLNHGSRLAVACFGTDVSIANPFSPICPIHVVTFTLTSNLATNYIQKRRGEPGLFSFEYNLSPNLISK